MGIKHLIFYGNGIVVFLDGLVHLEGRSHHILCKPDLEFLKSLAPECLARPHDGAALIASMVHYRTHTIAEIKNFLHDHCVKIRLQW